METMLKRESVAIVHGADGLLREDVGENDCVIFVDALRASNTVLAALRQKVSFIRLFSSLDEIRPFKDQHSEYVYIGEQGAGDIEGFDYNNSPTQISSAGKKICSRTAAMVTSNFTKAVGSADAVTCAKLVGSLLNAATIRSHIVHLQPSYRRVFIVAVGKDGRRMAEDDATAAFLRALLLDLKTEDIGTIIKIYRESESARIIRSRGYADDIEFCLLPDSISIIPEIRDRRFIYQKA